jgi:hypothetical protein
MTQHASSNAWAAIFRAFAAILIAWFGASALASASGGQVPAFHFDRFVGLLITIAFGFAMITFYSRPIGFRHRFYHLIIDQGLELSGRWIMPWSRKSGTARNLYWE